MTDTESPPQSPSTPFCIECSGRGRVAELACVRCSGSGLEPSPGSTSELVYVGNGKKAHVLGYRLPGARREQGYAMCGWGGWLIEILPSEEIEMCKKCERHL